MAYKTRWYVEPMIDALPGLYRIDAGRSHCELFPKITDAIRNGTRLSVLADLLVQEPTAEIRYLGIVSPHKRSDSSSHVVEVDRHGNVSFSHPDKDGLYKATVDLTASEGSLMRGGQRQPRIYLESDHGLTIFEGQPETEHVLSLRR